MRDASFGPVLLVVAYCKHHCSLKVSLIPVKMSYIIYIIYISQMIKKDILMAQMTRLAWFGPVLLVVVSCKSVRIAVVVVEIN